MEAADPNGIFLSATPGGAGELAITGALATDGVATLDSHGWPRQVGITSAGDETGVTFTITGQILKSGNYVTEVVAGLDTGVAVSVGHFYTVSSIVISGAGTGDIIIGTNGVGSTGWIPMDDRTDTFDVGIAVTVGAGTVNWTVQWTQGNVWDRDALNSSLVAFTDSAISAKAVDVDQALPNRCRAVRLQINSGTDPATMYLTPAGVS